MPEPFEIGEAAADKEGDYCDNDTFEGEDDELETIVAPLVVQNSRSTPAIKYKHKHKHKHKYMHQKKKTKTKEESTSTRRIIGENQDNNDGGMLSLCLWLGAAVVISLIMYNLKHLGEMEDTAAEELQNPTAQHTNASSAFVNKTIHPR
jgi:hypothetical protein